MKKDQGIVLFAFGKRGYAFAAFNMALSIKHFNKEIKISLFIDKAIRKYIQYEGYFDNVVELNDSDIYSPGVGLDPAKVKTNLYDKLPYKENLYLDVDGCALKDLQPLIDLLSSKEGSYLTEVRSLNTFDGEAGEYHIWASNKDIWENYNLKKTDVFPAIQSSFAYIKKSKEAEKFFKAVKANFNKGFDTKKLLMRWGSTVPDELIFSATCAKEGVNPDAGIRPIFFGWSPMFVEYGLNFQRIKDDHYITAIFGNGNGIRTLTNKDYIKWYDKLMNKYGMAEGYAVYGSSEIMKDKHVNNTTL